ncbi:MAG: LPD38 domain-containing protein [Rhodospirillales bacterium]
MAQPQLISIDDALTEAAPAEPETAPEGQETAGLLSIDDAIVDAGGERPDTSLSFGQSVGRGVDLAQAMGGGFVEASGEATGLDTLRDWGREVRTRNMAEAGQAPRSVNFEGIRSMGDFGTWAKETIGEQLPLMAPSLAGGVAGGAIGAATPVPGGMVLGAALGAFAPSLVLGTGEVQMNIKEKSPETESPGAAFVGGTAIAALDTILHGKIGSSLVRKLGREAAETVAQRALMKRVAVEGGKGLAVEGITEAIQEAIAEVSAAVGTDQDPDWEGLRTQMIEAGAAGALMGGGASAITAMVPDRKAPLGPTDQPEQTEQPAMPVQEPDPRGAPPAPEAGPVEAALQGSPAPEAPPPGVQGEQTAPDQTGVPFMITAAMREELGTLGYGPEQIRTMRPEEANSIIGGQVRNLDLQAQRAEPQPTEAQKEAGNYRKGHVKFQGLDISVENPKGSERSGTDAAGNPWSVPMQAHYGYIKRTEGGDGEQIDAYIGPVEDAPNAYVVDQITPETGKFDEHKVVLGVDTAEQAQALYDAHFNDGSGPARRGAVTELPMDEFKSWVRDGNTAKPLAYDETQTAPAGEPAARDFDLIPVDDAVAEAAGLDPIKQVRTGAPRKTGPQSLLEWIADRGGITDPGGDLRAMGADSWHRQAPFRRKLVKDAPQGQGGMFGQADVNSPDYVREAAIEAGYLPEGADVNALLGAIDAELRGQDQVRPEDQEVREARARDDAIKDDRMRRGQMIRDIRALRRELGETFHKQEVDAVVSLMETDPSLDAAMAVEFHIERLAIQAAETYRSKTDDDAYDIPFESTRGETEPQRLETGDDQGVDGQAPEPEGPDAGQTPGPDSGQDGNAQGVIPPTETLDTADGKKEQTVIPGAERDQRGANQRRADAPLKASEDQKGTDGLALFDEGSRDTTGDMFAKSAEKADDKPFDSKSWDAEREDRIKKSKAAGNQHLDDVPAYVETMRGKKFYYVHDPKERGTIRTVANTGDVVVHWADKYSADKNLADPKEEKRRGKTATVYESWLAPTDLKDYAFDKPAQPNPKTEPVRQPDDQNNGPDVKLAAAPRGKAFSDLAGDQAQFSHEVDQVLSGKWKNATQLLTVGETPLILNRLGVKRKKLRMQASKPLEILSKHSGMTADLIKRAPALISDPVMVMRSGSKDNPGALVAVLDETDSNGEILVAVVSPGTGRVQYNTLSSVYGKNVKPQAFIDRAVEEGRVRYFNEEMALNHPGVTGVQFPRWGAVKRLNNNVLSHADFVKEREKSPDKYRAGGDRAAITGNLADLESDLRNRLKALGVSDPSKIAVRVKEELETWVNGKRRFPYGRYRDRLIEVALDAPNPFVTMNHEAIHAFRDLGLFTPMEWKVLTNNVKADKDLMAYIDGFREYRDLTPDERIEEAVAFKFQDRDLRGRWKVIKDRISAVMEAIGNWLRGNGFQSAEDVFRAIERGEVGSRQETRAPGEGPMLAAAYHGSPHDFDAFSTDRIGTGEGAQAFGWGLYFAGKKEVAEHYRRGLSYKQIRDDFRDALPDDADFEEVMDLVGTGHFSSYQERVLRALDADDWLGFDYPSQAISAALGKNLDNWDPSQELRDAVKDIGRLYEVNLAPQEDEYLLWDKPLSEQSEKVRVELLKFIGNEPGTSRFSDERYLAAPTKDGSGYVYKATGGDVYREMAGKLGPKEASLYLRAAGIPGIKYLDGSSRSDGDGTYNYVIFDESLVEVKAKYQMREAAEPEYTLPAEERAGPHEATISRIMGTTDKPVSQRIREGIEAFKENGLLRMKQGFLDQFAVIEDYERARFGDLAEANLSPFKATHMTQNLQSVMGAVLRFGPLKVEDGWFKLDEDFGKGFEQIFEPLAESGKLRLWKGWAIANRAKRLMDEGREHLLTEAEINELLPLGDQHPEFQQVLDEWTAFNQKMLDMAEAAGLINADQRALWEKSDYVPFYRVIEDAETIQAAKSGRKGLEGQRSGIKALRGGESKINDPLENMVLSMTSLVDRSFKNLAMQKVTALLEDAGAMEQAPKDFVPAYIPASEVEKRLTEEGILDRALSKEERDQVIQMFQITAPRDPDVVSVMVGGKPVWYKVHDPLVLKAVSAMTPEQVGGVMKIFRMAKRTLTQGITADPAFMLANFMRDVGSAFVTAPIKGMRPGIDAIKGFKKALMGDTSLARLMAAGGGSGGFYRTDPSDVRKQMDARHRGIDQTRIIDTPKKAWEFWRRVGQASEAANRIAIMEAVQKNGGSDAEAAYQALDLMDFSMRGDFAAVRWFIETVPFMNARIQGLYRLYRGARDNPKAFMLRGAIITAASMALLAANWNDERYQDLEDWDKDTYYHFWIGDDHYRLPKPFEVGAIFSTIPERMMRLMAGQDDGEKAAQRVQAMFADTFAMNPIPQLVKPMAELWANKSFFTDRDIVGMGLDRLDPEAQWTPWTSLTARWLGEVLPDALGDAKSPKRIDHLVRGYFGALGMYVLGVSDSALRLVGDYPDAPDKRREDIPVLGRFLRDTPARSTVHVTDFYDMQKEAGRLLSTIREYERRGMTDEARELFKEHRGEIRTAKGLNKVASVLSNINRQIRAVNHHPTLSPAEKRRLIDALTEEKNRVVKMAANRARATMSIIEDLENKPQAGRKLNPLLN